MRRALSITAVTAAGAVLMSVTAVAALTLSSSIIASEPSTVLVVAPAAVPEALTGSQVTAPAGSGGARFVDPVIERAIARLTARASAAAAVASPATLPTPRAPGPVRKVPADDDSGTDRSDEVGSDD